MLPRGYGEHVPVKMHRTTLVFCLRKDLCHGIAHSEAFVSHDEPYTLQTAFFEPDKEAFPAFCIFLHAFRSSDDLTVTVLIHADCHQNADIFKLSAPISLEINPVHINIRIFPGQPAVAPFLDMHIRFLIQITDGGSRHTATPKSFRNIFHAPDRNVGEIHLDQGFFDRAFTAAVALNDCGFKRDTFQLRDIQRYLSGCGCQLAAVVSRTVPLP